MTIRIGMRTFDDEDDECCSMCLSRMVLMNGLQS